MTGHTSRIRALVVLRLDGGRCLLAIEAGDNVTPALVIVHTERDGDLLAGLLVLEAHSTRGAAAAHGEDVNVFDLVPVAAVGVVPHGLLDDAVVALVAVGLEDADGDGVVAHAVTE